MTNYKFTVLMVAAVLSVFSVSHATFAGKVQEPSPVGEKGEVKNNEESEGIFKIASNLTYHEDSPINLECFGPDFQPVSNIFTPSDWSSSFRYTGVDAPTDQFIDINGDGLVDYFSSSTYTTETSQVYNSCVYLNTGSGFEPVHRCYATFKENADGTTEGEYRGDCAG